MLEQLNDYLHILTAIIIVIGAVLLGASFFFIKKGIRVKAKNEDESDYSSFDREDASTYLEFDDIIDTVSGAIMVVVPNKQYIAMLSTVGSEWKSASRADKIARIGSEVSRMSIIKNPMEVWQYAKPVDMSDYIKKYEERRNFINNQYLNAKADYEELKAKADFIDNDNFEVFYEEVKKKRAEVFSLDFQRKNIDEQIAYVKRITGPGSEPEKCICYVFEWNYDPINFTDPLEEDEIWRQAAKELDNLCKKHIDSLAGSGVYARRMNKAEMIEAIRRQTCPITADIYNIDDIIGSSFNEMVVESDSLAEELELKRREDTEDSVVEEFSFDVLKKKQRYNELLNDKIRITIRCTDCGKKANIDMTDEQYGRYRRYLSGEGLIQDMLYDLKEEHKELILSGLCQSCLNEGVNGVD
ncbi:MAG: hypothetical protein K6G88_11015 [Lachnospiraceae bacterium]|nr:hypothetical protein [Lachnospiraceae bacterium]